MFEATLIGFGQVNEHMAVSNVNLGHGREFPVITMMLDSVREDGRGVDIMLKDVVLMEGDVVVSTAEMETKIIL